LDAMKVPYGTPVIYVDNQATIALASNPVNHLFVTGLCHVSSRSASPVFCLLEPLTIQLLLTLAVRR
jgi:hypothetical protein